MKEFLMVAVPILISVVASLINRVHQMPECPAKTWGGAILRFIYRVLVDWPAAKPMKGAKGQFKIRGREYMVPFASVSRRKKPCTPPPLAMPILLVALLTLSACSWMKKSSFDCAKEATTETAGHVMPIVADLIIHGSDWKAELSELVRVYSEPFITCLVGKLFERWDGTLRSGQPGISPEITRGHSRADEWLKMKAAR